MKNPLVTRFGNEKRWVNYRKEEVKGKMTKVPYSPITKGKASSTDVATWGTVYEAFKVSPEIGIIFTADCTLLGVDIDHCLRDNKIEHEQKEAIERFIKEANTYCEISPSGDGLHLFFEVEGGLELDANRHGSFECYTKGRYFTVTSKPFGAQRDIRRFKEEQKGVLTDLLAILGYPWGRKQTPNTATQPQLEHTTNERGSVDDQTLLAKIFASKNGLEVKKLYDGDTSAYGNDASVADMGFLAHLAFWTRKDAAQMERIWLASPLGNREKTQTRPDYRVRSITACIDRCGEVYEGTRMQVSKNTTDVDMERVTDPETIDYVSVELLDLLYTLNSQKDKVYTMNTENMCRIMRQHDEFKGRLKTDTFKNTIEIKDNGVWRNMEDSDAIVWQTRIQILFNMFQRVGKDMIYDAMVKVAKDNQTDSAADYLRALEWDGVARLDTWLTNVYNVEDNEYHRAVASNWMKGLVKRIMIPGCKFDYVMVLEGEQGTRKSTSLGILGGDWYVETTMSTDSKDFFMQLRGKAIIEFSEGETLSRTEVKRMKAIITTQVDTYRPAYGRLTIDFPRRCVFAMTTNQSEYLKDETGNRRWLPVACQGTANTEWLKENRDQLFAEAYERVINKREETWNFPEEATRREQEARQVQDANTDLVAHWYINELTETQRKEGITVHQVYQDCLCRGFATKPLDKWTEMAIANLLKHGLALNKNRKMMGGVQMTRWFQGDQSIQSFDKVLIEPAWGAFDEVPKTYNQKLL